MRGNRDTPTVGGKCGFREKPCLESGDAERQLGFKRNKCHSRSSLPHQHPASQEHGRWNRGRGAAPATCKGKATPSGPLQAWSLPAQAMCTDTALGPSNQPSRSGPRSHRLSRRGRLVGGGKAWRDAVYLGHTPEHKVGGGRELTQGLHPCRGQHRGGSSF